MIPKMKATATERNIPTIIVKALSVLMSSESPTPPSTPLRIFIIAIATVAPSNSKTRETDVEVGRPNVLNTSKRIRLAIITAR